MDFLNGKKTYLVMIATILVAAFNGFSSYCGGLVEPQSWCITGGVPEWIYAILASLGILTRKVAKP